MFLTFLEIDIKCYKRVYLPKKNMKYIYLLLFFCASSLFAQGSVDWELLNPKPSKSTGIDIVMTSSTDGIYITNKEIIKTTDGGATWSIKKQIPTANDLDSRNDISLVVGDFGTALISTDSGEIWSSLTINNQANLLYCKIFSNSNLLAASSKTLYFSADSGNSWSQRTIPFSNIKKILFLNDQVGFVGTNDGKIYKTIDGGVNWIIKSSINISPSDIFTFYFFNDSIGFAERGHGDLLKTTNGGETWIKTSSLSDKIYAFSFVSENVGFAAGADGVIFKTVDGGNTWANKFFQYGRIYQTTMFGIHFTSENVGIAVGQRGRIVKTQNSGDDWNQYSPFYNDVRTLDKVGGVLFAKVDLDIFKSVNDGSDWTLLNRPSELLTPDPFRILQYSKKIKFITKDIGFIIGGIYNTDSRLFKTLDGGNTWSVKKQFNVAGLNDVYFINENIGFVCGGQGTMTKGIFKTVDGGTTWMQLNIDQLFVKIKAVNENIIFASTYSNLYKSADGGLTWNLVLSDDNQQISDFNFIDESNGYAIGNAFFKLRKTTDGGNSWTKIDVPYQWYDLVKFSTKNIGLIANEYGVIYRTFNAGRTWQTDSQNYASYNLLYAADEIYLAGQYGNIFKGSFQNIPDYFIKTDEVTDFSYNTAKLTGSAATNSSDITDLKFTYSKSASFSNPVIIHANNTTVNSQDSNDLTVNIYNLEPNTKYYVRVTGKLSGNTIMGNTINFNTSQLSVSNLNKIKFQISPNPVEDELYFEASEKITKIEIYDLSGKLVVAKASLDIRSLIVDKLPKGTFVVKIYSDSEVYTSKFIKK